MPSAGTCCIPAQPRARAVRAASACGGRTGPFIAATDYMRHRARPDPPVGARRAITCSAPTASAAAIRARRCAASSRSTGATSRSRRSRRSPTTASSTWRTVTSAIKKLRHRSRQAESGDGLSGRTRGRAQSKSRVPDIGDYKDVEVIDVLVKAGDTIALEGAARSRSRPRRRRWTCRRPRPASCARSRSSAATRVSKGDLIALVESTATGRRRAAGSCAARSPGSRLPASRRSRQRNRHRLQRQRRAASPRRRRERPSRRRQRPRIRASLATSPTVPAAAARAHRPHRSTSPAFRARTRARRSGKLRARARRRSRRRVTGTGAKGRITADDVKAYVKQPADRRRRRPARGGACRSVPDVDFAAFGPVERKPLTRIQKISGPRLQASWVNIPHVTQFDEADITEMEETRATPQGARRRARGIKLTPLAFIMRACVQALAEVPAVQRVARCGGRRTRAARSTCTSGSRPTRRTAWSCRSCATRTARTSSSSRAISATLSEKARAGKLAARRHAGRLLHDLEPRRHRRHGVHADHQCARSRDPRRVALRAASRSTRTAASCRG